MSLKLFAVINYVRLNLQDYSKGPVSIKLMKPKTEFCEYVTLTELANEQFYSLLTAYIDYMYVFFPTNKNLSSDVETGLKQGSFKKTATHLSILF